LWYFVYQPEPRLKLKIPHLPRVHVKGLAGKILALSARQMPRDWEIRYGCRPLLLETLVDVARFRGTCYCASQMILTLLVGLGE
jgi:hypothetical protein